MIETETEVMTTGEGDTMEEAAKVHITNPVPVRTVTGWYKLHGKKAHAKIPVTGEIQASNI